MFELTRKILTLLNFERKVLVGSYVRAMRLAWLRIADKSSHLVARRISQPLGGVASLVLCPASIYIQSGYRQ